MKKLGAWLIKTSHAIAKVVGWVNSLILSVIGIR